MIYFLYIWEAIKNYFVLWIPAIVGEIFLCSIYKKRGIKIPKGFIIGWQLLIFWLIFIFTITGAAGIHEVGAYGNSIIRLDEINLIPFQKGSDSLFGMGMNVILFIPIGMGSLLLWKSSSTLKRTTIAGFCLSFMVEVSQLFNFRATDVNDLIMNTLGTMIGYGVIKFLFGKMDWKRYFFQIQDVDQINRRSGALCNYLFIFFAYFFLGAPFLNLVWRMFYHYE